MINPSTNQPMPVRSQSTEPFPCGEHVEFYWEQFAFLHGKPCLRIEARHRISTLLREHRFAEAMLIALWADWQDARDAAIAREEARRPMPPALRDPTRVDNRPMSPRLPNTDWREREERERASAAPRVPVLNKPAAANDQRET